MYKSQRLCEGDLGLTDKNNWIFPCRFRNTECEFEAGVPYRSIIATFKRAPSCSQETIVSIMLAFDKQQEIVNDSMPFTTSLLNGEKFTNVYF